MSLGKVGEEEDDGCDADRQQNLDCMELWHVGGLRRRKLDTRTLTAFLFIEEFDVDVD